MNISLVICTFNRAQLLAHHLDALSRIKYPARSWELIIVDNNSSDSTAILIKQFINANPQLDITVLQEIKQGKSYASNAALRQAKYAKVVFLDDDVEVSPLLLQRYRSAFERWPGAAIIGGRVRVNVDRQGEDNALIAPVLQWMLGGIDYGEQDRELQRGENVSAGNMAMCKDIIPRLEYNEHFGRVYGKKYFRADDFEICLRAQAMGYKVVYAHGIDVTTHVHSKDMTPRTFFARSVQAGVEVAAVERALAQYHVHVMDLISELKHAVFWSWSKTLSRRGMMQIWTHLFAKVFGYYVLSGAETAEGVKSKIFQWI